MAFMWNRFADAVRLQAQQLANCMTQSTAQNELETGNLLPVILNVPKLVLNCRHQNSTLKLR